MNSQKANGRSSSHVGDTDSKRRRLVESQKNNMFRPTPGQSALIQNQLTQFFKPTESTPNSRSSSVDATSPLSNLKIRDEPPEKSRHELFLEQLRLREEHKRRQKQAMEQEKRLAQVQYEEKKRLYIEEQQKKSELKKKEAMQQHIEKERQKQQKQAEQQPIIQHKQVEHQQQQVEHRPIVQQQVEHRPLVQQQQHVEHQPLIQQRQQADHQPLIQQQQAEHQPQQIEKMDSDDDIIIDEEMTNKNVCIGMVKTDIVVEKSPLILIRDEQYEIVSLESEGKLNTDNYSFKVTSRSQPPRFYGWVPFKDTKILGPLVDHRLIWWDAVIPRGKATNTRTPLCIILYCRPDLLTTIGKYFESQRLFLKTPPFYNPACRYTNPHDRFAEPAASYQHHQHQHQHQPGHVMHNQQQNLQQQQYQNYRYQQQQQQHQLQQQQQGGGPYNHQQYAMNNFPNERQSQKDIEMLLASIPSDVPLLRKKKKSSKKKNAITILSDDEEESVESEEVSEDELESGYVEGLKCHLMDHQIKGVSWMIDRENNESSNGGILADDMGLGKTIQTIALMASTMTSEDSEEETKEDEEDNHQITLIVTPLALIHQWVDEILTKTEKGKLRVLKHHGPNRTKNYALFKRYDVVVTTYQVVASDMPADANKKSKKKKKAANLDGFVITDVDDDDEEDKERPVFPKQHAPLKKNHGPLFQLNWHRIVLDEAQFIKNRTTKASLSCATLSSVKRWCLTGTPIQNNVDELYSLLRFLRIQPLSDYPTFKKTISIPIMNGDTHIAMNRLKAVLMAVMLRRTKSVLGSTSTTQDTHGEQIDSTTVTKEDSPNNDESLSKKLTLKLPTRQKTDILLTFTDHEQALYQLLLTKSKDTIQAMVGNQNRYMNMLCLLLRLRQACDHPQLILNTIESDNDALDIISDVTTTGASDNNNLSLQQQISCELCGRPNNNNEQKEQTPYCADCTSGLQSKFSDRRTLFKTSTKVGKLMEILKQTRESNPGEKTIVFSQFTSMLNLLEEPLKREGFKICRYDGSMSSQLRERSLSLLKHDSKTTVMLISLKCGSLGLNLTAANRVILVDLWWNPALEEQAIDRVHRIGQKLPVYVTRLLIENTVELKIVELQEKKAQLTKGALGDGLVKSAKLTASEIKSLFDL